LRPVGRDAVLSETQTVTIQGKPYNWSAQDGLDTEAVMTLQAWIVECAKKYLSTANKLHLELDDLIQAGNIGALKAARTYDPAHDCKFITWATPKIHTELMALCSPRFTQHLSEDVATDIETAPQSDMDIVVSQVLERLSDKDREILAAHYGIGHAPITQSDIAKAHRLSTPRINQKIYRALVRARLELKNVKRTDYARTAARTGSSPFKGRKKAPRQATARN